MFSLHVVLTHVDAVRSWNSFDPGIFANLVLASFFRKMTATEQELPSVSTANGTTMEDGGLPFSYALSWQPLYFRSLVNILF
jgi:hypothetical protein